MKYHEKLNLKSPIFKYNNTTTSRTPSKSPIKPAINPADLFQKVCCPSCKFGFKIIRQQVMKENPPQKSATPPKKNKYSLYKEIQTQTEGILTQSNSNSPVKSIISQHKFAKTYDFNGVQNIKEYQMSRVNEIFQQQNIENRQSKDSQFKFKPLSLSPHSKFSKSKNLLKTLDSKPVRVEEAESPSKSPVRSIENINPYYVQKDQQGRKRDHQQTIPFRDQDQVYNKGNISKEYYNGGNIEREPIGYGNSNARGGEGGLVSPHASSQKLEQNQTRGGGDRMDQMGIPLNGYGKSWNNGSKSKSPQYNNSRMNEQEERGGRLSPRNGSVSYGRQMQQNGGGQGNNNANQYTPNSNVYYNQDPSSQSALSPSPLSLSPLIPQTIASKKDSPQFQQLISQIVLRSQQQQNVIRQLQQMCKMVSQEVELPSYCKMLGYAE